MVEQVGKSGTSGVKLSRVQVGGGAALSKPAAAPAAGSGPSTVSSMVFDIIQSGPPVDMAKVGKIKEAIAQGNYPIDADKIAERMIALDLPAKSQEK